MVSKNESTYDRLEIVKRSACFLALFAYASAQTLVGLQFDSAEIRLNTSGASPEIPRVSPDGRISARNIPLSDALRFAFEAEGGTLVGIPNWADEDHFDIAGKATPATSPVALRRMLQTLLAREFKISLHPEERQVDVFVLRLASDGNNLQQSTGPSPSVCRQSFGNGLIEVRCRNRTMADFGNDLRSLAPNVVVHPVIDQTGLAHRYHFNFSWSGPRRGGGGGAAVIDALNSQVGLILEARKMTKHLIVIDHMERMP
jgi:uncharacterized protein (TIGR03435 family)